VDTNVKLVPPPITIVPIVPLTENTNQYVTVHKDIIILKVKLIVQNVEKLAKPVPTPQSNTKFR
jgi:hypothetical protein